MSLQGIGEGVATEDVLCSAASHWCHKVLVELHCEAADLIHASQAPYAFALLSLSIYIYISLSL